MYYLRSRCIRAWGGAPCRLGQKAKVVHSGKAVIRRSLPPSRSPTAITVHPSDASSCCVLTSGIRPKAVILVLNAAVLHSPRARHDCPLVACSIDGVCELRAGARGSMAGLLQWAVATRLPLPHARPRPQRTGTSSATCMALLLARSSQRAACVHDHDRGAYGSSRCTVLLQWLGCEA